MPAAKRAAKPAKPAEPAAPASATARPAATAAMAATGAVGLAARLQRAKPVAEAIDEHAALKALLERARESQARLVAIGPLLARVAPGLEARVRAGALDEGGWMLLADDAAAAAKLRQCLPMIEAALHERGWSQPALKVKVRPR